jgi:hypothetical protein
LENTGKILPDKARFRNMTVRRFMAIMPGAIIVLSAAALAASISGSDAGAYYVMTSAPQSIAAQLHHQPTVASVAAAEETLAAIAYAHAYAAKRHVRARRRAG